MLRLAVTGALLLAAMGAAAVLPSLLTGGSSESAAPTLNTPASIGRTFVEASPLQPASRQQPARRPRRPAPRAIDSSAAASVPFVGAPAAAPVQEQPTGTRPERPSAPATPRRATPRPTRPSPGAGSQQPLLPPAEPPPSVPPPAVEAAPLPQPQDERSVLDAPPPAQQQPTEQPPAEQPPAEQPPGEEPPGEEPPGGKPPGWDPQPPATASPSEPDRQAEREARREQREAEREQRRAELEAERGSRKNGGQGPPQPVPYSTPDATEPEQAWQPELSDGDDCNDD